LLDEQLGHADTLSAIEALEEKHFGSSSDVGGAGGACAYSVVSLNNVGPPELTYADLCMIDRMEAAAGLGDVGANSNSAAVGMFAPSDPVAADAVRAPDPAAADGLSDLELEKLIRDNPTLFE
jgi:hypothetical protein